MTYSPEVLADAPWGWWRFNDSPAPSGPADSGSAELTFRYGRRVAPGATALVGSGKAITGGNPGSVSLDFAIARSTTLPSSLNGANVTVAGWFAIPAGNVNGEFVSIGNGANGWGFGIGGSTFDNTGRTLILLDESVAWRATSYSFPAGAATYHIMVVRGASNAFTVYVNGSSVYTGTHGPNTATSMLTIGGGHTDVRALASTFNVDDVAFFASALSGSRATAHYNAGAGDLTAVAADSPVSWVKFDETTATAELDDTSGNSRTLRQTGTPPTIVNDGTPAGGTHATFAAASSLFESGATVAQPTVVTYEAWVKLAANPSAQVTLVSAGGTDATGFTSALEIGTDGKVRLHLYTGSTNALVDPTALSLDTWHHIAASVGAAGAKIRVDKTTVATNPAITSVSSLTSGRPTIHAVNAVPVPASVVALELAEAAMYFSQLSDARTDAHYDAASLVEFTSTLSASLRAKAAAFVSVAVLASSLAATTQPKVAAFQSATVAGSTLSATLRPKTAAFTSEIVVGLESTLAGTLQSKTAVFASTAVSTDPESILAATVLPKTAAFTSEVVVDPTLRATQLASNLQPKIASFISRAITPIIPIPAALRPVGLSAVVVGQAFGPVTMTHSTQPVYSVSQASIQRARQQIVIAGVDITFLRNVWTPDVTYTLLTPLRYGPGTLVLPQVVACAEPISENDPGRNPDLAWMKAGATIEINLVLDDPEGIAPPVMAVEGVFKGVLVAWDLAGSQLVIELGGEASGRAALRDRQPVIFPRINDIGHQISDAVKDLGLPVYPGLGNDTGIEVMTTGGVGHLEHIQNLCAQAWTRQGKHWTIMPNDDGAYVVEQKSDSVIHGTVFFDDTRTVANLRRDLAEEPNRIFITGVTPKGQKVRFGVYPGLIQGPVPPFPGHLESGDTGQGVRLLVRKLQQSNYLSLTDVAGGYDNDVVEAVKDLQRDAGLSVTGEVNENTWNALYDLTDTGLSLIGAHIEPAAQDPRVRRVNRSANGTVLEFNDEYDPTVLPVDRTIDAGVGKTRSQLREFARTVLEASLAPNWVGDITFNTGAFLDGEQDADVVVTPEIVKDARTLIPTQNLWAPRFDGGTQFNVSACGIDNTGLVSATVDTRFRDAMEVWAIIDRNKESRNDPARRRQQKDRSSTINKDSVGEWDEVGGVLGTDVILTGGQWTQFEVVAALEGQIAWMKIALDNPAEFAVAVFGRSGGKSLLNDLIPEPLGAGGAKKWQTHDDALDDRGLLVSIGTPDEPCGYGRGKKADGDELTGRLKDEAGFRYWSEDRCRIYVCIWVAENNVLPSGRIMRNQLESGA